MIPETGLYLRMARASEVLKPTAIIVENVPTVTYDVRKAVQKTVETLNEIGYTIGRGSLILSILGVPQKRRRHVIIALRHCDIDPQNVIESLKTPICDHTPRTVRWAIGDLENVCSSELFDSASRPYPCEPV